MSSYLQDCKQIAVKICQPFSAGNSSPTGKNYSLLTGIQQSANGINGNPFTILAKCLKGYDTIDLCEQRVITATAHVFTRVNPGAQLADNNTARTDVLTAIPFHTPSLAGTVTTIPRTTTCFFMCHGYISEFLKINMLQYVYGHSC
jgi:hypothetical protein